MDLQDIIDHLHRYFVTRYGVNYVFRAPETFDNALERWMLFVMSNDGPMAERAIQSIESYFESTNK